MPKPPITPLTRAARLLDLVPFISSHQGISLQDLSNRFGISEKEITQDLTTLWMCGLPGYTPLELMDLSFDSGFVSISNAQTLAKPRNLTSSEIIALLLGLDLVRGSLAPDRTDLISELDSLAHLLSAQMGVTVPVRALSESNSEIRSIIDKSLQKNIRTVVKYHSLYNDEISTRTITPVQWRYENSHEYIFAFCEKARALRTFRVDRIISATTDAEVGKLEESVEIKTPVEKVFYTIKIHSRLRTCLERFGVVKITRNLDLGKELEISAYSPEWVRRSVMGSSGSVELCQPQELRHQIRERAESALRRYEVG